MWELGILELLIAFFLLLPLIRPFIRRLWPMDSLAILPLLALGVAIGLFPAYGIRPECLPLILYVIILNIANLPALGAVFRRLKNDDFRDRGPFSTGLLLSLLIAVTALAIYFVPSLDLRMADAGVRTGIVRDTERNSNGRPVQLFLRIYEPDTAPGIPEKRALMVLIPPAMGSLMTVDGLCGELSRRGFTVLTYSRKGIDFLPGRALEEERKQDLAFLLTSLLTENTDQGHVFIAGFGAGGAAAVGLAASPGFTAAYPAVQGIIGLECPLQGTENPPLPAVPAFYILSDRALYAGRRENRYMSILESFRRGTSPAALAMVPGAGPLDYSDVPEKHPLLSLLFSGDMAPVWTREDYISGTASLIINFAAALDTGGQVFHRTVLDRTIFIDTNRAWNLTSTEYILGL